MRITLLLLCCIGLAAQAAGFLSPALSPQEVNARLGTDRAPLVVDVRKPAEFAVGHIPGAINIPLSELDLRIDEFSGGRDVLVYCINGSRTRLAEPVLLDNGIPNIYHLEGAFYAWIQSGMPIEKGPAR